MSTEMRIIKILDEFTVVINAGFADNINTGTILQVYSVGEPLVDPVTKESLGTLDNIKAEITVTEASEHVAKCVNRSKTNFIEVAMLRDRPSLQSALELLSSSNKPLNVDPTQITRAEPADKTIHIGDLVRVLPSRINKKAPPERCE